MPAAAPRIDERLLRFIEGAPLSHSAAEITRAAGALAWELGLPRPSYEQVRLVARDRQPASSKAATLGRALDVLYEYPGPGLADWYAGYLRGDA